MASRSGILGSTDLLSNLLLTCFHCNSACLSISLNYKIATRSWFHSLYNCMFTSRINRIRAGCQENSSIPGYIDTKLLNSISGIRLWNSIYWGILLKEIGFRSCALHSDKAMLPKSSKYESRTLFGMQEPPLAGVFDKGVSLNEIPNQAGHDQIR